jgi:hypothetical protein
LVLAKTHAVNRVDWLLEIVYLRKTGASPNAVLVQLRLNFLYLLAVSLVDEDDRFFFIISAFQFTFRIRFRQINAARWQLGVVRGAHLRIHILLLEIDNGVFLAVDQLMQALAREDYLVVCLKNKG